MSYYIDDEHGTLLTAGVAERDVMAMARRYAAARNAPVSVYMPGSTTRTVVEPDGTSYICDERSMGEP